MIGVTIAPSLKAAPFADKIFLVFDKILRHYGAGSENRTRVSTLGRSHSATKPYPQNHSASGLRRDDN